MSIFKLNFTQKYIPAVFNNGFYKLLTFGSTGLSPLVSPCWQPKPSSPPSYLVSHSEGRVVPLGATGLLAVHLVELGEYCEFQVGRSPLFLQRKGLEYLHSKPKILPGVLPTPVPLGTRLPHYRLIWRLGVYPHCHLCWLGAGPSLQLFP